MKTRKSSKAPSKAPTIIGWREWVGLPELGVDYIKAKIDTGARTSALHAEDQHRFEREGSIWVSFVVLAHAGAPDVRVEAPVLDDRNITNTSGVPERRTVIPVRLHLGAAAWNIELSLADRSNMGFDLILGRTSIRRRRILVDPGRSFLLGRPHLAADSSRAHAHSGELRARPTPTKDNL